MLNKELFTKQYADNQGTVLHKRQRQNSLGYEVFSACAVYWRDLTVLEHERPIHPRCHSSALRRSVPHLQTNRPIPKSTLGYPLKKGWEVHILKGTKGEFSHSSIIDQPLVHYFAPAYPIELPDHQ